MESLGRKAIVIGATDSWVFYSQTKGEMEDALPGPRVTMCIPMK